ncbi:uncharacterized protein PAC_04940 [Phialocephala subalpina]|uniref:Uncharacterized protein n=1 Tax=Phialocephala subalpina TaxID=576137 RepID=A0A1L7WQK4_9HELO|nr:uncharacterized protein PAC_04940 [Phialocephala subalpina]
MSSYYDEGSMLDADPESKEIDYPSSDSSAWSSRAKLRSSSTSSTTSSESSDSSDAVPTSLQREIQQVLRISTLIQNEGTLFVLLSRTRYKIPASFLQLQFLLSIDHTSAERSSSTDNNSDRFVHQNILSKAVSNTSPPHNNDEAEDDPDAKERDYEEDPNEDTRFQTSAMSAQHRKERDEEEGKFMDELEDEEERSIKRNAPRRRGTKTDEKAQGKKSAAQISREGAAIKDNGKKGEGWGGKGGKEKVGKSCMELLSAVVVTKATQRTNDVEGIKIMLNDAAQQAVRVSVLRLLLVIKTHPYILYDQTQSRWEQDHHLGHFEYDEDHQEYKYATEPISAEEKKYENYGKTADEVIPKVTAKAQTMSNAKQGKGKAITGDGRKTGKSLEAEEGPIIFLISTATLLPCEIWRS